MIFGLYSLMSHFNYGFRRNYNSSNSYYFDYSNRNYGCDSTYVNIDVGYYGRYSSHSSYQSLSDYYSTNIFSGDRFSSGQDYGSYYSFDYGASGGSEYSFGSLTGSLYDYDNIASYGYTAHNSSIPVQSSKSHYSGVYNASALPEIRNSGIMKNVPEDTKNRILDAVDRACKQYNVDPKLVIAMMKTESNFNPRAKSRCGAMGLMQLMPGTAKDLGVKNAYDIEQNIFGGVKYISKMLKRFNGNRDLAVAAYNAGPGRVKDCVPNIKETKNYVRKVNNNYNSLC